MAEKQKWYCWQGHKYKATWGQVVEFMTVGGRLMYAHATVPCSNIQDMRAIWIESEVGLEATAEQIYDRLEIIAPQTSHENIFVHKGAPPAEHGQRQRWFGIDQEFYNNIPTFPWYQIFNMTGAPLREVKATGKAAKRAAEYEVDQQKRLWSDRMAKRRCKSFSSCSSSRESVISNVW